MASVLVFPPAQNGSADLKSDSTVPAPLASLGVYFGREKRRSYRFRLRMPMTLIRNGNREADRIALTSNISSSGVYFTISDVVQRGTLLEFVIPLPEGISLGGPVRLRCRGIVVRVEPQGESVVGVAATITRYEFQRHDELHGEVPGAGPDRLRPALAPVLPIAHQPRAN